MTISQTSIYANGYSALSDISLKENIEDVNEDDCIDVLRAVKPNTYTRGDLGNSNYRLGFIAQELHEHLPNKFDILCGEITKGNEDDITTTLMTVDYSRLCAVLWGVCRKLDDRISELENKQN